MGVRSGGRGGGGQGGCVRRIEVVKMQRKVGGRSGQGGGRSGRGQGGRAR